MIFLINEVLLNGKKSKAKKSKENKRIENKDQRRYLFTKSNFQDRQPAFNGDIRVVNKKRENQRFRDRDNRYNRNKKKFDNNKDNGNGGNKRFGSEIKVVSTNVTKEDVKTKDVKKETGSRNRTQNYQKPKETPKPVQNNSRKIYSDNKNLLPYQMKPAGKEKCSICDKMIEDMPNAIIDRKDNKFYHFTCVVNKLSKENPLETKQRMVYLGSGAFGVIENAFNDGSYKFLIKKKIQFAFDK